MHTIFTTYSIAQLSTNANKKPKFFQKILILQKRLRFAAAFYDKI